LKRINQIPVPAGWRIIHVDRKRVRAKLIRQHKQYYAVGDDVRGSERCGVGATVNQACDSLRRVLEVANRSYERFR
jgi:hypothetical protein